MLRTHARLRAAHLVAELPDDGGARCLEVRSRIDPAQHLVLAFPGDGGVAGVSLSTRLSRCADLPWALAYGCGALPEDAVVRFSTLGLRWRRTAEVLPQWLSHDCWVADVEGAYDSVAVRCAARVLTESLLSARC